MVLLVGLAATWSLDSRWSDDDARRARAHAELLASDVGIELSDRLVRTEAAVAALANASAAADPADATLLAATLLQQTPLWFRGVAVYDVAAPHTPVVMTAEARDAETALGLASVELRAVASEAVLHGGAPLRADPGGTVLFVRTGVHLGTTHTVAVGFVSAELLLRGAAPTSYVVRDGESRVVHREKAPSEGAVLGPYARTIRAGRSPWLVEVHAADDGDPRLRDATFWAGIALTLLIALWVCRLVGRRRDAVAAARLYRSLFEVASDLVLLLDEDLHVLRANEEAARLLGFEQGGPRPDAVGLLSPSERSPAREALRRGLSGARSEFCAILLAAPERHYRFRVVPVLVDDAVFGLQVLAEDITTQHALEQEVAARREELERLNDDLYRASITDGLTGVHNRRHLEERAESEVSRARRYARPLSCLFVDLDHFKRVNDTHGHGVGDDVLRAFASLLVRHLRCSDLVGRYGGEEFVVLLTDTGEAAAQLTAEKLRRLVRGFRFPGIPGKERITVSIGVAGLSPPLDTVERLFAAADTALYRAKDEGRDRVVVHEALAA